MMFRGGPISIVMYGLSTNASLGPSGAIYKVMGEPWYMCTQV